MFVASPFKSVMNDLYAKDISKKVRTTMNVKRANGKFIGAFAPYGYLKDPADKNSLIVDKDTASIVKRIFDLYVRGSGFARIAHLLNEEGIPCPSKYKAQNTSYRNPKSKLSLWTHETISKMLINPTYAGNLAQNKYSKVNYKVKKLRNVPREQWTVTNGTHEGIIDQETFDLIQSMIANKSSVSTSGSKSQHLLSGLIYCGDCGQRMTYTTTQNNNSYCICSKYKRFRLCTRHSFLEDELESLIISELRKISTFTVKQGNLIKAANNKVLTSRQDILQDEINNIYEDKLKGVLTESDFMELSAEYNDER